MTASAAPAEQAQTPNAPTVEPQAVPADDLPAADIAIDDAPAEDTQSTSAEDQPQEQAPDPDDQSPNKVSARRRIGQLTAQRHAAEAERDQARQAVAQKDAEIAALRQQNVQSQTAAMLHYAATLESKMGQAQSAYQAALESNDPAKIAEANTTVAKVAAEKSSVDAWVAQYKRAQPQSRPNQQQPNQQQPRQAQPNQQQPAPAPLRQETQDWAKQNDSWFNPRSPDYDPDMRREAEAIAMRIEAQYDRAGRAQDIGGKDYIDGITAEMRKSFPDHEWGTVQAAPRMKAGGPVAASSAPGTQSTTNPHIKIVNGRRTIPLSSEERSFARGMPVKYPHDHPKVELRGRPMSPDDKERDYALQKAGLKKGGVPVTIRSTGTKRA